MPVQLIKAAPAGARAGGAGGPVVRMISIDHDTDDRLRHLAGDLSQATGMCSGSSGLLTEGQAMGEWPENWADLVRGVGCDMCRSGLVRPDSDSYGIRIHAGRCTDAYLQRADVQRGYTVVIWRGRHVTEPTELNDIEAAEYWAETLKVSRALIK